MTQVTFSCYSGGTEAGGDKMLRSSDVAQLIHHVNDLRQRLLDCGKARVPDDLYIGDQQERMLMLANELHEQRNDLEQLLGALEDRELTMDEEEYSESFA